MTATTLASPSRTQSPFGQLFRATPVVGRVIRDIEREVDTVFYLLTIFITTVILAIQLWGLPALVVTALALVPVMFVLLVILARP
jgi:hypothetical protein